MTYYSRHRDECLAYAAMVRAAYTEEQRKANHEYYKKYWAVNSRYICEKMILKRAIAREKREAARLAPKAVSKDECISLPTPVTKDECISLPTPVTKDASILPVKKKRVRKSKLRIQPLLEPPAPEPFGFENLTGVQKNVFNELAPQGWCEKRVDENPFLMTFK